MVASAHRRQFILAWGTDRRPRGWREMDLPEGWRLFWHPEAQVDVLDPAPAAPVIRIGRAFNLDAKGWQGAGRFALIRWPQIVTDAGALLALHYGAHPDGRRVVSSSPALAAAAVGAVAVEGAALEHRSHFNYVPAPATPFGGIAKLLHDQALDLSRFEVAHRPSQVRPMASHDAALATLAGALCRFAEDLRARTTGRIFLPLTAGLDSRTLAAAFVAAGVEVETVTLDFCGKWRTDVSVARAIARRLGLRHRVLRLDPPDPALAAVVATATAGAALDWDHTHIIPGGGYRYLAPGDVMVSGGCFEIGRQTAGETCFRGMSFGQATGAEIWRRRAGGTAPPAAAAALDAWIAWRREHPLEMDFAAAFYLDQRLGGWRAALERSYDLLPGVVLCPANDPQVYSAMITPSAEDQRSGRLQKEAIGLLAPELLAFPLNPMPLRHRLGRWRRRVLGDLRARLGLAAPWGQLAPGE